MLTCNQLSFYVRFQRRIPHPLCVPESDAYGGFHYMPWTCQCPKKNGCQPDGHAMPHAYVSYMFVYVCTRPSPSFDVATSAGADLAVFIPYRSPKEGQGQRNAKKPAPFSAETVRLAGSADSKDQRGVGPG